MNSSKKNSAWGGRVESSELFIFNFCFSFYTLLNFVFLSFIVQIVEPFTAHYVFALGVARFLSCAHWILQVFP